ncbi:DNA polymerase III subunit beta [Rhizobium sp. ACO-34A]|nr:DNA polymerase III subunit beta [Rhizobium sp. ACO-34A]ATN32865.1 DNA polymerase III subunit beta [Rhizobium sp. ACO-34A]
MFTASKSAMLDALKLVGQIVERRNTIPVLQNVLFERLGTTGKLTARVTDLDIEATIPFAASIDTDFRGFTVPAHLLMEIVKKLPDGADIRVDAADAELSGVTLKSGRSRFRLQVLPPQDFPSLDAGEMPFAIEVSGAALERAIGAVRFAISTEETRYYLNGIYLHPSEGGLTLVATDGHRLSKRFIPLEGVPQAMPGVIVPRKTVEVLIKHMPKEDVTLQVSDAKIRVMIGEMLLVSKLIDGTFPDYRRVIPACERFIEVEGKALSAAIDRVSTVSTGNGRAVKLTFADGVLRLTVNNPDAGNAEDEIAYEGEANLETGFNAKYVNDALANLSEQTVNIYLGEAGSPAVLRADGDHAENLIVLMPMCV